MPMQQLVQCWTAQSVFLLSLAVQVMHSLPDEADGTGSVEAMAIPYAAAAGDAHPGHWQRMLDRCPVDCHVSSGLCGSSDVSAVVTFLLHSANVRHVNVKTFGAWR